MNKRLALKQIYSDDPEILALLHSQDIEDGIRIPLDGVTPSDERLLGLIKPLIPTLPEVKDGEDGKDYILTQEDKKEIAGFIEVPVVEKVIEKTKVIEKQIPIVTQINKEVLPDDIADRLNTIEEGINLSVIKGYNTLVDKTTFEKSFSDVYTKKQIDQRWHGGGISKVTTDATLTGSGTPSSPLSVVGGGGGFTLLAATGAINSVNTLFTFTQKPVYIISDGAWYRENKGWTWSGLTATMTIPPNDDIYGFK